MIYRAYGRLVDSAIDLPADRADGRADLHLRCGEVNCDQNAWTNVWEPRARAPWVRVQRNGSAYRIRYDRQVDFQYSPADRAITIDVHDCAAEPLAHFVLDQVLPLVFSLDTLVLHASAVAIDGEAIAFCGTGGSGKSTLALLLERAGHPIVCDDALLVRGEGGRAAAVPSYAGLRFWPDIAASATGSAFEASAPRKLRVSEGLRFEQWPVPFEHLLVIDPEDAPEPRFEPMSRRGTAVTLLEHSYRLEQYDAQILAAELDRALGMSAVLCGWRFRYPRLREAWTDVAASVVAHLRSHAPVRRPSSACFS